MLLFGFLGLNYIDYEDILLNITILIWMAVMNSAFVGDYFKRNWLKKVGLGLILSTISIIIMSISFEIVDGFYFDVRTILLSLSGLFLGVIPTLVAVIISIIYRIS